MPICRPLDAIAVQNRMWVAGDMDQDIAHAGLKMLLAQAAYNPYAQALGAALPKFEQKRLTIICP
jgi:uncharacterized lipoprotein